MAKLEVKLQKIFADITATGASGYQVTQFGSLKASAPLATIDPTVIQALTAYDYGFVNAIINGAPPSIQDIDGLCRMLSIGVAYLQQAGIPEYNVNDEYKLGSFVSSTYGSIYISVAASNIGNALTDETKWMLYNTKLYVSINANYAIQYNEKYIHIYGTNPDMDVTLPAIGAHNKGRIIYVVNKMIKHILTILDLGYIIVISFYFILFISILLQNYLILCFVRFVCFGILTFQCDLF